MTISNQMLVWIIRATCLIGFIATTSTLALSGWKIAAIVFASSLLTLLIPYYALNMRRFAAARAAIDNARRRRSLR